MIYITGDTHGDFRRFSEDIFPEQKEMTKDDYVLILGDFGYWDKSNHGEYWRKWLDDRPFTTLWIDGNHENYDLLKKLPIEEWHGGKVQYIEPSIIHLMRGEIYDLDGLKCVAFGGARSHDVQEGILELDDPNFIMKKKELDERNASYRINHLTWWKEEMPNKEEMDYLLHNLEKNDNKVDFIFTHEGPYKVMNRMYPGFIDKYELNSFFDQLSEIIDFKVWLFGHHHEDGIVDNKYVVLYEQIVALT